MRVPLEVLEAAQVDLKAHQVFVVDVSCRNENSKRNRVEIRRWWEASPVLVVLDIKLLLGARLLLELFEENAEVFARTAFDLGEV